VDPLEAAQHHREAFAAHREAFGPNLASMLDEGLAADEAAYREARRHQERFRATIGGCFEGVDAWITPATDTTAPHSTATTGNSRFQSPWSYAGTPVVCVPCGVASDGMPAGVQLIGKPGDDEALLATAVWCERQFDFPRAPPMPADAR
jgi:Asp-tRNA(Asn)/Glu-tRNA(Gln) amidotransferase A subunit family amidase